MGLFSFIKSELIDIVEWPEEKPGVLVHRFNRHDNEIKRGAKLIVRPGQTAIFVNEGKIADRFEPGTYTLETANLPILTTLLSLPYGFNSWHKAEVYFIKRTEQLDRRWGTQQPIMMRDLDFGILRIRAFGNYSYRIGTTDQMLERLVGARSEFKSEDIESQLCTRVVSELSDSLGELKIPALDLAANYNEIGERVKLNLTSYMASMGIELTSLTIANISLPDEVNAAIDKRGAVGALGGVMNQYSQMQAADALKAAAENQGGAGTMMGMMMGGQLGAFGSQQAFQQQQQATPPPPPPAAPMYYIAVNGQQQGPYQVAQLQAMIASGAFTRATLVWTTGMAAWQAANTVPALAALFAPPPPPPAP